ncbi:MAG: RimK family alpha-L-glutamate ligase [Candidatus Nanohaloarchaea archaeon]
MINIGILWDEEVSWNGGKPFNGEPDDTYSFFSDLAEEENVRIYIAKYSWYRQGALEKAWKWNEGWEKVEQLDIDGVFDKFVFNKDTRRLKRLIADEVGIINDPELEELCKDKLETYRIFPDKVPETRKASGDAISEMRKKYGKVVLKPRYSFGAKGIHILDKGDEVPETGENYIVQRFVDSSGGIDGLVDGSHDLRAIIVNGEIEANYLRYNENSRISNVSEGGVKEVVDQEEFPEEAVELVEEVNSEIDFQPSIFSVDIFFDSEQEPWIVELNSKPGLNFYGDERMRENLRPVMESLLESFRTIGV